MRGKSTVFIVHKENLLLTNGKGVMEKDEVYIKNFIEQIFKKQ